MRNTQVFLVFLVVYSCLTAPGCKKWLELSPPSTKLTNGSVFEGDGTATAALLNLYSGGLQSESWNISQSCGLLSDELYGGYSRTSTLLEYYINSMLAVDNLGPWISYYQYLYQVNDLIYGLETRTGVSKSVKQQLLGEARFLRAYFYFYLTNCYGDVPLILTTDYNLNAKVTRAKSEDIYKQVLNDLQYAKDALNNSYVDGTDTASTIDRVRPTSWAAMSMMARVFLYRNEFDSAFKYSNLVISNTSMFGLTDSLNDVFLVNSIESIWQLATTNPVSRNTIDGNNFILKSRPGVGNANTVTISDQLLGGFESGDMRKTHWIGSITVSGKTYLFPNKYKAYRSTVVTERTVMLRLAEQYLIRAEAEAYKGDFNGAAADLNKIRRRAGLSDYWGVMEKEPLLNAIMKERRMEYFSEWGHRWFDLLRTGAADSIMEGACLQKGAVWKTTSKLFPIPQSERDINRFLTQNNGY